MGVLLYMGTKTLLQIYGHSRLTGAAKCRPPFHNQPLFLIVPRMFALTYIPVLI
jgi:hypothetical protein